VIVLFTGGLVTLMVRVLLTPAATGFGENDFSMTGGEMIPRVPSADCVLGGALFGVTSPGPRTFNQLPGLLPTTFTSIVQKLLAEMIPLANDADPAPGTAVN